MTLKDAAKLVNVEPVTLRRAIKAGELEAVELGRGYQVTREALQAWIDSKKVKPVQTEPTEVQ